LAAPIDDDLLELSPPPQQWLDEVESRFSHETKLNIWHGLSPSTRTTYKTARTSFEYFCQIRNQPAFPAQRLHLIEWVTLRSTGSSECHQDRITGDTIASYLSALRSVHVDRGLPTSVFDDETLKRVIAGIKRRQPHRELSQAKPITLDILELAFSATIDLSMITENQRIDEINTTAAATVAFGGFLHSGEFTYEAKDLHNKRSFKSTSLLRLDITFSDLDEHVTISLKRSKTDYDHVGVDIIIAATATPTCPVQALRRLFEEDPQPLDSPLFRLSSGPLSYHKFVAIVRQRLQDSGVANPQEYSGHSFRRGAATQAKANGMLNEDIQRLGRWSSEAFRRYIDTDAAYRFRLSRHFLTGRSPAFSSMRL
jgi:hypothetical protein